MAVQNLEKSNLGVVEISVDHDPLVLRLYGISFAHLLLFVRHPDNNRQTCDKNEPSLP